jgi:hypothetical protein
VDVLFPSFIMAQYNTGYPPYRLGDNKQAYELGCKLLDMQDRLLVFDKNKQVRMLLHLDKPGAEQALTWLSIGLMSVTDTNAGYGNTEFWALREARIYIARMQSLAVHLENAARKKLRVSNTRKKSTSFLEPTFEKSDEVENG